MVEKPTDRLSLYKEEKEGTFKAQVLRSKPSVTLLPIIFEASTDLIVEGSLAKTFLANVDFLCKFLMVRVPHQLLANLQLSREPS